MLNVQDIQAIGVLLDQKLKTQKEEIISQISAEITEMGEVANQAFGEIEGQFSDLKNRFDNFEVKVDKLSEEIAKRPTKEEIFSWADRRLTDLEIGNERHDFLHIDELDKLPSPAEINKALIERGFKQKFA